MRYIWRMAFHHSHPLFFCRALTTCVVPLVLSGCFDKPADISGYLDRAKQELAEGHPEKAKLELQQAVRAKPTDPTANLELARVEDSEGDLENAVPHYLRAATPDAKLIDAQLRVIEILIDSNRFTEAMGRINTTLGVFPNNLQALALRADLEERQNQEAAARNDAVAVLQRDPMNSRALAALALIELNNKNGQQALALVQKGLGTHPKELRLLQVQAAALMTLDQPDKALAALQTVVTIAPRNIAAQLALADMETQNGHFDTAFQALQKAVAADPSDQNLKIGLVNFLARNKKGADVKAFLQEQIAREPKSGVYDLLLAEYERSQGDLAQSRAVLDAASSRLGPGQDGDKVRVALAKIALAQGNGPEAMTRLNQVLGQNPDNQDGLLTRATIELNNGQTAKAITDALVVTRADPVNVTAYQLLATAYVQLGQPKLALEAMRRATAIVPGDDRAQMRLATFLQTAGETNAAREIVARVTQSHPDDGEIWATAARLAYERHDWNAATTAIAHLRDFPDMSSTADVLAASVTAAQGNPGKAVATFKAQIEKAADVDPGVIALFASASVAAKQADEASDFLRARVPSLSAQNKVAAWASIMAIQADAGHFDIANAAYDEAARLAPADLSVLRTYVRILISQKDYARAIAAVSATEKAGASHEACATLLGNIYEAQGNLSSAEVSYKQAYDANPDSTSTLNNFASIAADQDSKNIALLSDLRKRFDGLERSDDPSLVDTIAWLDYRLNKLDEAKVLLSRIKAGQSANPQIRFHQAAVLLASGDKAGGMALLDTLKGQTFPGMNEAHDLASM